jgi:hypothetical protein
MTNLALGNSLSTQFRRASWAAVPAVRIEAALSEDSGDLFDDARGFQGD